MLTNITRGKNTCYSHTSKRKMLQCSHRIFTNSRSIINRDVRLCHPPGSVHVIEKIFDDFKSGRASHAPLLDKTISLEYSHWLDRRSDTEYRVYFRK